jgi:glycerate kinase
MLVALGGTLRPGAAMVLETVEFSAKLAGVDLVITGEGRIDAQTLGGKAPVAVAQAARAAGVRCIALVGESALRDAAPFARVESLVDLFGGDRSRALREAGDGLASLARSVVRERS